MISMGFPGDEDPLFAEPEYECPECRDILMQDLLQMWFCPTCDREEGEKEGE
jgi:Zn finger protein HypA/HybF involved in hydrogenase expression